MIASATLADHLNPVALFVVALGVFNVGRACGASDARSPRRARAVDSLNASPRGRCDR